MPYRNIFRSLFALIASGMLLSLKAQSVSRAHNAWRVLEAQARPDAESSAPDWAAIQQRARDFQRDFPGDTLARSALRLELEAGLALAPSAGDAVLHSAITAFLTDQSNDVRDRVLLKMALQRDDLRALGQTPPSTRHELMARHGRELIRDFPDQPEGFGTLLAVAKMESAANARALANELLLTDAPPFAAEGARRVIARLDLFGRPLTLKGEAQATLATARGKPVIVYSWTVSDVGFLNIIRRYGTSPSVTFLGINLDGDQVAAAKVGATLPGTQFYDGGGLSGPLASQLFLLFSTTLFVLDANGVMQEVNGHDNPWSTLDYWTGRQGGVR